MAELQFTFAAPVWIYAGKGAWHFVTLPQDLADAIRFHNASAKGFIPIAVKATIGNTEWKTSVFPDSKSGSFLLALKAALRKTEQIRAGDNISVTVTIITNA